MRLVTVELLSEQSHNAIIRLPERAFPGVVIQGDTLATITNLARESEKCVPADASPELLDHLVELRERFESLLTQYEKALAKEGISLPYVK